MLLEVTAVLLGIGLAVAGFGVVVLVTVLVLRLIGVVLGEGDHGSSGNGPNDEGGASAP